VLAFGADMSNRHHSRRIGIRRTLRRGVAIKEHSQIARRSDLADASPSVVGPRVNHNVRTRVEQDLVLFEN